ncbi:MAG: hypothetical protein LBH20_09090 [Treponema sp.]|nr:hypothetical protein [Treponema sp.]
MMKRMSIVLITMCVIGLNGCITNDNRSQASTGSGAQTQVSTGPTVDVNANLNFQRWDSWGGIKAAPIGNTVTLSGKVDAAGYVYEDLDKALKNRRVLLEIKNASASNFSEGRMLKITANKNDQLIRPLGITDLIRGEFIPSNYQSVEFFLPSDFDGKLGFVFYQADLKDLQITATYQ